MNLRAFYLALLSVLVTVVGLSFAWEFWGEDLLLPGMAEHHESESLVHRWEFVITVAVFSALALIVPAVIGTRLIREDERLREAVIRLSQEDELTGLINRRRATQLLEAEIKRASRYDTAFCLILADVDHFKSINDRYGHQAGDEALAAIANVMRSSVRAADHVARWGGEEFVILSPQTDLDGGVALAEKVRGTLESTSLTTVGTTTASFGVTAFSPGDGMESLIARADAALYAAKQSGRNRVHSVSGIAADEAQRSSLVNEPN